MNSHEHAPGAAPPPGSEIMNVVRWILFASLLLLAVISIASWIAWRRGESRGGAVATAAQHHCPMHPEYVADRPGTCPICNMSLVPVPEPTATGDPGDVPGLAPVVITPERIQLLGVRTAIATRAPLEDELELAAFVAPDESRLTTVQVRVAGWIQVLHVGRTGQTVRAGQPLVTLYSPELFQSESEFLIARGSGADPAAARERLRLLGVPADEIARLEREGTAQTNLTLRAPVSGTVLERRVASGQSVGPETPLLVIADLSRPWVLADVYEMDLERVHAGDPVTFTTEAQAGRTWTGRIEFVYPTVTPETRTARARIALDGSTAALRPGVYGTARVRSRGTPVVQIPSDALIRSGARDYVFLARAGGRFEPRRVTPGRETRERVAIVAGLAAGDTVVSGASFLIDSESRLQAAISGMGDERAKPDPHAGHGR